MAEYLEGAAAVDAVCARELRRRARKLRACGDWLTFRHYPTVDLVRLHDGRFCQQDRMCGNCARRRGAKALRVHIERVLAVRAEQPQLNAYFGTWTLRNQQELRVMFDHLWKSWGVQLQRRRDHLKDAKRNQFTELARVAGGTISAEVKRGANSGLWHVHMHAMLLAEGEPDQRELSREWHEITGDSHVVHVRPFDYLRDGEPATADNLCRDFVEVFKYSVKLQDLGLADNWEAHRQLFGARMLRSFGCMWGVKVPESLLDDPLEGEDLPYVDWFYRYAGGGKYQLEYHTADESH